jgi:hypothetical protein
MPRHGSQDRVVGSSGEDDGNLVAPESHVSFASDKLAVDLSSIAAFKAPKLLGQHGIEGIGNHGHDDVEMDLYQDGGRKGIEAEEFDRLRDHVFNPPPSGVVANQGFRWGVEVIGDQEGGFFTTVATDDDLAHLPIIIRELDGGFIDERVWVLPFGMGDMNSFPGLKGLYSIEHVFASAPQGDKLDSLLIEHRELGVGGELGVEDKGGLDPPLDLFPKGEEIQHLIVGFLALDVGGCIEDELGGGVLGKKGQRSFHSLVSSSCPVLIKHGFFPKVRDGVKIQIDDVALIKLKLDGLPDKALLQTQEMDPIEAVRVSGDGRALGQHIETGKEPRARIEGMLRDMGIAFSTKEFKGQEGEQVADGRDGFGPGQSGLLHHFEQVESFDEGSEKEDPCPFGVKGSLRDIDKGNSLSHSRYLGPFDSDSQLEPSPARKAWVAFFSQEPFDGADRDFYPFFGEKLCDFSGRQAALSPTANLGPEGGINAMAPSLSLGQGFREVDLSVGEEVSEQMDIGHRIAEVIGDHLGRQTLDEGGAQGLISALPFMHGVEEECFVAHVGLI